MTHTPANLPRWLRWSAGAALLTLASFLCLGCGSKPTPPDEKPDDKSQPLDQEPLKGVTVPKVRLRDITKQSGINFTHTNGSFGKKLLPETMGAGVAFLDYNNDGLQDILFVNSCYWPGHEGRDRPTLKLYHNLGKGKFEDVTARAKLDVTMYGMGVCCGDFDNDGHIDIFVTGVGGNRLFRNKGDGTFEDATAAMKVGGPGGWPRAGAGKFLDHAPPINWSSSATFLDYDGDGKLDLFVCNYVTWSPLIDIKQDFTLVGVGRAFGPPRAFEGTTCFLYRNCGDHFEDVSEKAGVRVVESEGVGEGARQRAVGKSLGVVVCDVDNDGWPDVIVANDTVRNFFFHNEAGPGGTRVFRERGLETGVAYATSQAQARGAMGIDWGEYRPGKYACMIANFANEPTTFLRLDDPAGLAFQDVAAVVGIQGRSRPPLKFGTLFFDFDNDGRLDLLTCNGHLEPDIALVQKGQTHAQPAQLYWNTGLVKPRSFELMTAKECGPDLFVPMVGRGCAYADIDGDGSVDVVLTANGGAARLLKNEGGTGNHWVRLVLRGDGVRSNRSAIGARVEIKVGKRTLRREVVGARGYLSQSELPITVGLGKATKVDRVTVWWPGRNGGKTVKDNLKADTVYPIDQK